MTEKLRGSPSPLPVGWGGVRCHSATIVMDTAPCAACTYGQRGQRAISGVYRQMGMRGSECGYSVDR